jgi:glycosyltransferase involved in cell wall biosynthesis
MERLDMRIVIDMQGAQTQSRLRGIGRYTRSLTEAIIRNKSQHEILIVLNGMLSDSIQELIEHFSPLLGRERIYVWNSIGPTCDMNHENAYRRRAAEIIREKFIGSLKPDFLLLTTFFEGFDDNFTCTINEAKSYKTAVIFYDLIPLLNPEKYLASKAAKNWYLERVKEIKRADLLLSISEY